jgi:hypothetical protein
MESNKKFEEFMKTKTFVVLLVLVLVLSIIKIAGAGYQFGQWLANS